jgi:hypothetical protein
MAILKKIALAWRGMMVIASAYRTQKILGSNPAREYSRLVGHYAYIAVLLSKKLNMHCHCFYLRKINAAKNYKNYRSGLPVKNFKHSRARVK